MGKINVIEVKGQGHFAILLVKKEQFLQLLTNLSQIVVQWVKWSGKSIILLTKFKNTSPKYLFLQMAS